MNPSRKLILLKTISISLLALFLSLCGCVGGREITYAQLSSISSPPDTTVISSTTRTERAVSYQERLLIITNFKGVHHEDNHKQY